MNISTLSQFSDSKNAATFAGRVSQLSKASNLVSKRSNLAESQASSVFRGKEPIRTLQEYVIQKTTLKLPDDVDDASLCAAHRVKENVGNKRSRYKNS
jgi:hypothetical protein